MTRRDIWQWTAGWILGCGVVLSGCQLLTSPHSEAPPRLGPGGAGAAVFAPEAEKIDPALREFLGKLDALYAEADWATIAATGRDMLRVRPYDAFALVVVATAHLHQGELEAAQFFAREALSQKNSVSAAHNILGICRYRAATELDDYRAALNHFTLAFEADPREISAGINAGYLQLELGNDSAALLEFGKTRQRCASCNEGRLGEAISLARLDRGDEALALLEEVLSEDPQHAVALYHRARLIAPQDPVKAHQLWQKIIEAGEPQHLEVQEKARFMLRHSDVGVAL